MDKPTDNEILTFRKVMYYYVQEENVNEINAWGIKFKKVEEEKCQKIKNQ